MGRSREVKVVLLGDASQALRAFNQLDAGAKRSEDRLAATARKMEDVGAKLTTRVTAPLVGLGAVAFDAASDLNESMSKVGVVFDENADEIEAWSEDSAQSLGMSQQAALEAAGTFGNLFSSMGVAGDAATDMSQDIVGLASDLASFNNLDPTETLEKLRSGLVGEIEPLRALGVSFDAAAVQAKALQMGLADTAGELTEGAKVQARYQLILEQTGNAQGDFARTSDGAANQLRILKAEAGDAAAQLGTSLLPAGTRLIGMATSLAQAFADLPGPVQNTVVALGGAAAAAGPLVWGLGKVITAGKTTVDTVRSLRTSLSNLPSGAMAARASLVGAAVATLALTDRLVDAQRAASHFADETAALGGDDLRAQLAEVTAEIERQRAELARESIINWGFVHIDRDVFTRDAADAATRLDELKTKQAQLEHEIRLGAIAAGQEGQELGALGGAADGAAGDLGGLEGAQEGLQGATEDATGALQKQVDLMRGLTDPVFRAESAARRLQEAHEAVPEAIREAEEAQQGVGEAHRDMAEAQREVAEAVAAHGASSEEAAAARERLSAAEDRVADAQRRAADAQERIGDAQREIAPAAVEASDAMGQLGQAMVDADKDGQSFGVNFGRVVDQLVADGLITAEQAQTVKDQFGALETQVRGMDGMAPHLTVVPETQQAQLELEQTRYRADLLERHRNVPVGMDHSQFDAQAPPLEAAANHLTRGRTIPVAADTAPALTGIRTLEGTIAALTSRPWIVRLQADTANILAGATPMSPVPLTARARGGPIDPDDVYLVGEEGPELFVSDRAGKIVDHAGTQKMLRRTPAAGGPVAGPASGVDLRALQQALVEAIQLAGLSGHSTTTSVHIDRVEARDYADFRRQLDDEQRLHALS